MKYLIYIMGVRDLLKLELQLKDGSIKSIGSFFREVKWNDLRGTSIAIDAMGQIHAAIRSMRNQLSHNGKITTHIKVINSQIKKFESLGIKQIWVFDNPKPIQFKSKTLEARKKKIADMGLVPVTSEMILDIIDLLKCMGIPYVIAPEGIEGEVIASFLTRDRDVNNEIELAPCEYVYSNDTDVILYASKVLRPARGKSKMMKLDVDAMMDQLTITQDDLFKMAVALGNDFNDRIRGFGPKTVRKREIVLDDYRQSIYSYMKDIKHVDIEIIQHEVGDITDMLISFGFKC